MEQPKSVPDPYVLILNVTYLSLPRHLSTHVHVNPYITPCSPLGTHLMLLMAVLLMQCKPDPTLQCPALLWETSL